MDMRKSFVRVLGISLFAALMSGCIYSEGNDFGDWDDDDDGSSQGDVGVCFTFCEKLAVCGEIADEASCVDHCHKEHAFAPALTEQGAMCVSSLECKAIGEFDCPGAPFPPGAGNGSGGSGGSGGAGGSGGSGGVGGAGGAGGAEPVSCQGDCDCPSGTTCQQGVCG
ncbi:hypothetical protein [Polyangium aurulentum]|uniref:hypothetical protein n=1 Tax=Polyangium aurulentum TaxID=2567896 RepID=UPI0010AEBC68|nr:hypothetical protein [Polyangium aurulentum]UQA62257.1 hypothetical protein E8A73_018005 [Polyangium aurulentum]